MSNSNQHIAAYLNSYLKMAKPGFAVMIRGAWGCGKTYFIRKYSQWYKFSNLSRCYISLYGVTDRKDLEARIFKSLVFKSICFIFCCLVIALFSIWAWLLPYITAIIKYVIPQAQQNRIEFWAYITPFVFASIVFLWKLNKTTILGILLKRKYLVFDDFERAMIDKTELLGYINEYVEHFQVPVIIICNEEEVIKRKNTGGEPEAYDDIAAKYLLVREKVIGKTFELNSNDNLVMTALVKQLGNTALKKILSENMEWFISIVLQPLQQKKSIKQTNYRALQHCLRDFEYYFQGNEISKYLLDSNVWQELIPRFFSLKYCSQIIRVGLSKDFDEEFAKSVIQDYGFMVGKEAKEFYDLFPCWTSFPQFLSVDIWYAIIDNQPLPSETIAAWINDYLSPQQSLVNRLNQAFGLEDEDFVRLIRDTGRAARKHEIHDQEDILQITNYMLYYFDISVDSSEHRRPHRSDVIKKRALNYIHEEIENKEFQGKVKDLNAYCVKKKSIELIQYNGKSKDIYTEIKNTLIEAMKHASLKATDDHFETLLKFLSKSEKDFQQWFYTENNHAKDLYSAQDSKKLLDALLNLNTKVFVSRVESLRGHIQYEIHRICKTELDFWRNFHILAQEYISENQKTRKNYWKWQRLVWFCDMTNTALDDYEKNLNTQKDS